MKVLLFALVTFSVLLAAHAQVGAKSPTDLVQDAELNSTLARYADASAAFYNGQPEAVRAMWSHADDVTLSGAAGGPTAKGWNEVSKRLGWASAQFKDARGSKTAEIIKASVSGDLAYIVQYEHIRYTPSGQAVEAKRDYRVTTIFRRKSEGWRVVHRHADTLMERQDIQ